MIWAGTRLQKMLIINSTTQGTIVVARVVGWRRIQRILVFSFSWTMLLKSMLGKTARRRIMGISIWMMISQATALGTILHSGASRTYYFPTAKRSLIQLPTGTGRLEVLRFKALIGIVRAVGQLGVQLGNRLTGRCSLPLVYSILLKPWWEVLPGLVLSPSRTWGNSGPNKVIFTTIIYSQVQVKKSF